MNMTAEQYAEMYRRFPGVESFIDECLLKNEYRFLTTLEQESAANEWQRNRLAHLRELEALFERKFV